MLRSQLFMGDPRLEACLINDSAHVIQGTAGDYVSKIQAALCWIDCLNIDAGEITAKAYGPSTAAAVLSFKTKRNIINRSYETQADNIVGKMTIAALDNEMAGLENQRGNRLGCTISGGSDYLHVHLALGFLLAAAAGPTAGAAPTEADIMRLAFQNSRDSLRGTIRKLNDLITAINHSRGGPLDAMNQSTFNAVVKWLRVDPRKPSSAIPDINSAIGLMNQNLALKTSAGNDPPLRHGGPIVVLGSLTPTTHYHANTPGGPDRGTNFGDDFFAKDGPHCQRDVVTHEFFHMLGVHHGGGALNGPTVRAAISNPAQALDSADNLAQLVAELTTPGGKTDACARAGE
ncbi:MAG: hypothetical protein ABSG46_09260 [Candidatus Binataceae bacterium]|jgi:hypothetical protein